MGYHLSLADTAEAKKIASEAGGRDHLWRQVTILKRECKMDSDQLDALTGRTEAALVESIEALCGVLMGEGACDDLARRAASTLVSLWLGNPDVDASNEQLMKVVRKAPLSRLLAFAPSTLPTVLKIGLSRKQFPENPRSFVTTTRKSRTSQDHLAADSSRERVTSRRRQGLDSFR